MSDSPRMPLTPPDEISILEPPTDEERLANQRLMEEVLGLKLRVESLKKLSQEIAQTTAEKKAELLATCHVIEELNKLPDLLSKSKNKALTRKIKKIQAELKFQDQRNATLTAEIADVEAKLLQALMQNPVVNNEVKKHIGCGNLEDWNRPVLKE
ncbi:hypothetical protein L596_000951 [Steinernema carpocapsae]|uniref:Uncharacterized protein n=1 Tax=Steinernema carpocapsae TaxID=34508 RepID=A0A4V6I798_STECR|nr:hypothetical protein L596_000951 [Steinernema carpocapsae]